MRIQISSLLAFPLLLMFIIAGCTTMKPMDKELSRDELFKSLNPGDKVSIYTKDSKKQLIIIDTITKDYMKGGGKIFKFDDIIEIRKEKFSPAKTTGAFFAILGSVSIAIGGLIMLVIIAAGG
jgi:nitrogen regulatory protein PII